MNRIFGHPFYAQAPADAEGGSGGADAGHTAGDEEQKGGAGKATETEAAGTAAAKVETADAGKSADAGSKGGDAAKDKAAAKAPEFKVTLPEGVVVDPALMAKFAPIAQELKLTSEGASKLAALHAEATKSVAEAWDKQGKEWGEQLKTDKDFGGKKYDETVAKAQKAILRFGGKDLAADLEKLGVGNLPSLVKAFAKVGQADGEDSSHVETSPKPKPLNNRERLAIRYDHPSSQRVRESK